MRRNLISKEFKSIDLGLLWLAFFVLQSTAVSHLAAGSTTVIRLFDTVHVDGDQIQLGDIAAIQGPAGEVIKKIGGLTVGRSPLPGKTRRIDPDYIKFCLRRNGIDLTRIIFKSPPTVEIYRAYVELDRGKIKKIISDIIKRHGRRRKLTVQVEDVQISSRLLLPKGRISYSVVASKENILSGTVPFDVNVKVNGRPYKTIRAWAKLKILMEVVVTKRPIGRYRPIGYDDITLQKIDTAHLASNIITDLNEVLGQRAKRNIDINTVLRTDLIEIPPLVKRGDMVLIMAESGGLKITTLGRVRTNGLRGERVKVVNFDSKKSIFARVVDANTVQVDF